MFRHAEKVTCGLFVVGDNESVDAGKCEGKLEQDGFDDGGETQLPCFEDDYPHRSPCLHDLPDCREEMKLRFVEDATKGYDCGVGEDDFEAGDVRDEIHKAQGSGVTSAR